MEKIILTLNLEKRGRRSNNLLIKFGDKHEKAN